MSRYQKSFPKDQVGSSESQAIQINVAIDIEITHLSAHSGLHLSESVQDITSLLRCDDKESLALISMNVTQTLGVSLFGLL